MALRPQCNRLAVSINDESAYGILPMTGVVPNQVVDDAKLVLAIKKRINPREPVFMNPSVTRVGNESIIKGSEFATDPANRTVKTAQDIDIPFTVDGGLSTLGWCLALAFGLDFFPENVSVAGQADTYRHNFFASDLCVGDQFPSTALVLGFAGTDESQLLVKGAILNELRIALTERGFLEVSGTLFTDGTVTDKPVGFDFAPLALLDQPDEFLTNLQMDFLTANVEDPRIPLVSQKGKLRGFELTINNNLDRDDARGQLTSGEATLGLLRTGDREITLSVSVEGHQGDANWNDFVADMSVPKDVQIRVEKTAPIVATGLGGRLLDIRARNTLIDSLEDIGFDGIRSRFRLGYKLFADPVSDYTDGRLPVAMGMSVLPSNVLTPLLVEVRNGDPEYFLTSMDMLP